MPTTPRKEINISSDAFDEITGALHEAGIKLEKDDSFTITKDMAIKGPINYRQVNLRHQILIEVSKVYKTPITNDFEVPNSEYFIKFLDDVYEYIKTGEKKSKSETTKAINPNKANPATGW